MSDRRLAALCLSLLAAVLLAVVVVTARSAAGLGEALVQLFPVPAAPEP